VRIGLQLDGSRRTDLDMSRFSKMRGLGVLSLILISSRNESLSLFRCQLEALKFSLKRANPSHALPLLLPRNGSSVQQPTVV
jgi:hypothetical protein